jgi:hypothetical protein
LLLFLRDLLHDEQEVHFGLEKPGDIWDDGDDLAFQLQSRIDPDWAGQDVIAN